MTPEISNSIKENKKAFWEWKEAGKPNPDHPLSKKQKETKRNLRSTQRLDTATKRTKLYSDIMSASENDSKNFHKLIQQQRTTRTATVTEIRWNDNIYSTPDDIRNGFYQYFQALAIPSEDSMVDANYKQLVDLDFLLIEQITDQSSNSTITISLEDIASAIKEMNRGKAPDILGISAEHIQYGGQSVATFREIIRTKIVPEEIKEGLSTPIVKKNKPAMDPTNYRGITVLVSIEKLFIKLWLSKGKPHMNKNQNKMQRGFSENSSSINTGFLYSETLTESKECKEPIYVVTLDGQKAFDTVWIRSLLRNMYFTGISNDLWSMLNQLYSDVTTKVKFDNIASDSFQMLQGVRQAGILSAPLYKQFNNKLLDTIEEQSIGAYIGPINIPAPTCADDICCITNSPIDLQACLYIVENFMNMERAKINNSKSDILRYNTPDVKIDSWKLCNSEIKETNSTLHLGMTRNTNESIDIDKMIQAGRQTLYSLFGAGLHGRNGLNPRIAKHIWSTYVIPRLIYGLEIQHLTDTQIQKLNQFQIRVTQTATMVAKQMFECCGLSTAWCRTNKSHYR